MLVASGHMRKPLGRSADQLTDKMRVHHADLGVSQGDALVRAIVNVQHAALV